jgi:hypothetical protein
MIMKKQESFANQWTFLFFFFLVALGFELRASPFESLCQSPMDFHVSRILFCSETVSHQAGLKHTILLPQPSKFLGLQECSAMSGWQQNY